MLPKSLFRRPIALAVLMLLTAGAAAVAVLPAQADTAEVQLSVSEVNELLEAKDLAIRVACFASYPNQCPVGTKETLESELLGLQKKLRQAK